MERRGGRTELDVFILLVLAPAFRSFLWVLVYWLTNKTCAHQTKWPFGSSSPLVIAYFTWRRAGKCKVKYPVCVFRCVSALHVCVWNVRIIQSAISLCEDSLHKHTRHAEDVVILRLIVCVSDVYNQHQTRGGFTLPLSLFSVFASNCTNCPIVLLLLHSLHLFCHFPLKVWLEWNHR